MRPGEREDYDALISDVIKSGYTPAKVVHLWSVDNSEPSLDETISRSFYSPLHLAQALAAQDLAGIDIALVSNRLQQVYEESVRNPARAVLLGPARVIPKELPGIGCRSIDVDLESGKVSECAAPIVAEMASARENITVAFRGSERFIETLDSFDLSASQQRRRLQPGGVYLITGGVGGIGLVVAEHIAREFKARLVLLNYSDLPLEAKWESALNDSFLAEANKQKIQKLIEIRSLAGGLLVAQGDVTNLSQMRGVVALARQRFGGINGIFHAAGTLDDGPLMLKTARSAARVLDPKVRGTLVLEEALRDLPLSCFVLFSSISFILPPAGPVDYAAANAFLDAFALSRKDPVIAIDWGAWREVGIAARAASSHPLLDEQLFATQNEIVYSSRHSQPRQWLLSEHRLKPGKALIPGTGYLEMAAAAFARGSLYGAIEFTDVFFLAPLTVDFSESRDVRIQLRREQESGSEKDAFRFLVAAQDGGWVEHCAGNIASSPASPVLHIDRTAIEARCNKLVIAFDEERRTKQERYFDLAPRWHCLKRLHIGLREGLAELELDDRFSGDCLAYRMHPAIFDLATGCSLYLIEGYELSNDLYLPFSYRKLSVYRPFSIKQFSYIRSRQENRLHSEIVTFDITLFNEEGQVLAEIEGFSMRRVAAPAEASEDSLAAHGAALPRIDQLIESFESSGIPPLEGARALTRILQSATPLAIVAVSQPIEFVEHRSPGRSSSVSSSSAANSVLPAESIEGTLAASWQDLLGVEQVGLDDDFFALGGHSLVGVRLFAKVKKTYRVDLELAVLFEARTVRQLAEVIRKSRQPGRAEEKTWPSLVPIQPNGSRIPFFCVHAAGGDVFFVSS